MRQLELVVALLVAVVLAACSGVGDGSDRDADAGDADADRDGDADADRDDTDAPGDADVEPRVRPLLSCSGTWSEMADALDVARQAPAMTSSLASDFAGTLLVAWHEWADFDTQASYYDAFVRRWDGSDWQLVGGSLDRAPGSNSQAPRVEIDAAGNPIVAWHEECEVHVSIWDGSSWIALGGALNEHPLDGFCAGTTSIAVDGRGAAIVAWNEWSRDPEAIGSDAYVARWDGSSWEVLGGGAIDRSVEDYADFAVVRIDSRGAPIVKWNESDMQVTGSPSRHDTYVARWDGSAWELFGDGPVTVTAGNHTYGDGLDIDSEDRPVLAIYDLDPETSDSVVAVMRWTGSRWEQVGEPLVVSEEFGDTFAPIIVLDRDDTPIVALCETDGPTNRGQVLSHDGSVWTPVGDGPLPTPVEGSACPDSLVLDEEGHPIVTMTYGDGDNLQNVAALRCE